ncbi:hypothetical protein [Novosphingobium sp.]|uniref:hypothetical protein n=1 Tax=Novosphingobium sp. TaxID=1874826 RepID=UPI003BACEF61
MPRILLVGIDPDQVDFADPALPPGMTAEMIRRGVQVSVDGLAAAGHAVDQLFIPAAKEDAIAVLSARLAEGRHDMVIIGGGVIIPPSNRLLFEAMLNVIVQQSPAPAVGLIARPEDAPTAAARVLGAG